MNFLSLFHNYLLSFFRIKIFVFCKFSACMYLHSHFSKIEKYRQGKIHFRKNLLPRDETLGEDYKKVQGVEVKSGKSLSSKFGKNQCLYWNKRYTRRKPLISALIWNPESGRGIKKRAWRWLAVTELFYPTPTYAFRGERALHPPDNATPSNFLFQKTFCWCIKISKVFFFFHSRSEQFWKQNTILFQIIRYCHHFIYIYFALSVFCGFLKSVYFLILENADL